MKKNKKLISLSNFTRKAKMDPHFSDDDPPSLFSFGAAGDWLCLDYGFYVFPYSLPWPAIALATAAAFTLLNPHSGLRSSI